MRPESEDGWSRLGRGRRLGFFALDEEVDRWLERDLLASEGPYQLVLFRSVPYRTERGTRMYRNEKIQLPSVAVSPARAQYSDGFDFSIVSEKLSPGLADRARLSGDLSFLGCIVLQHGSMRGDRQGESQISLVDRIGNERTGEVVEHADYRRVFEALRRGIRADLVYSTIEEWEGGRREDDREPLMTEGAARAVQEGRVRFSRSPGRRLGD